MISSIVSRLVILVFGTLYPAYASYKAVRTKNVKEYVKWMMYWIVFALFTCAETFTDVFLSFWFPFYYEIKIILVLWLLSPATKGSSILYRKFVHPMLSRREQDIDEYIAKAKEQGYHTVLHLGTKGVNYATTVIMQTAIKGGGGLVQQLRRSYSLSDLSTDKDMADVNRNNKALSNIPDDDTDEADEGSIDPRLLRPRGYSPRRSASGSGRVEMYFPEVDVDVRQHTSRQREPSIPLSHIRSSEDVSSGYSSAEPLYAGHHPTKGEGLVQSREPLIRTASVGSTRSVRAKSSRGGVVSKRTPTTEDSERWSNEEADFPNQEEYSYYISSSLPSQLASIPFSGQSPLSQEDLLLILQEIHSLKAQKLASNEIQPIESVASESVDEKEPQLTETICENIPDVSSGSESKQHIETNSINILDTESSVLEINASASPLPLNSVVSDLEPEISADSSGLTISSPCVENNTNLSNEVLDDSEMFFDADKTILSSSQEDGSELVTEHPCSEDNFVDAHADVGIIPLQCEVGDSETVPATLNSAEILGCGNAKDTSDTAHSTTAENVDDTSTILNDSIVLCPEVKELEIKDLVISSETSGDKLTSSVDQGAKMSDTLHIVNQVGEVFQDPDLSVALNVSSERDTAIFSDQDVKMSETSDILNQVEDQKLSISEMSKNEEKLTSSLQQDIDVSEMSGTVSQSAEVSQDYGLCTDESAVSDTFADLSISSEMSDSRLVDISDDLNASSETLKFSEGDCFSKEPEMSVSTTSGNSTANTEEKKDIRSGRYHKRHAPAPPERGKDSAAGESSGANGDLALEMETDTGDQMSKETAVKARLVLQPGIVKAVGPDTRISGSTSKAEKFISSSPKAKRKVAQRSKPKQKGSAISRLLVMPKNQLGHLTSYLPFWGSRDTKTKSAESVASEDSDTQEQETNISLSQEKKQEVTSPQPIPPQNYLPSPHTRTIPISSCSLEYLPYIEGDIDFDTSGMDKAKSNSISDFKIREMSHSPPPARRSEQVAE